MREFSCLNCGATFSEFDQTNHDYKNGICPYCGEDRTETFKNKRLTTLFVVGIFSSLAIIVGAILTTFTTSRIGLPIMVVGTIPFVTSTILIFRIRQKIRNKWKKYQT
jgi:uncharacterized membrane protein YoaK (UPF0700 family)